LLGGEEWIRAPYVSNQHDDIVFVGDARENLGALEFTLVLTTRRLLPNRYPNDRETLADRVIAMRDERSMTFPAISCELISRGLTGARGARLTAESVFSMYKKRKAYLLRRLSKIVYSIPRLIVYPAVR